jgi:single-strand DNA-binding protein
MNIGILIGYLTRDVELRRTGNGTAVASFTVAVNRTYGEEQQTDFIPCVIWKAQAENMARYCGKGSRVAVEGRIQSRTYQDNDGKNRTVIELVCNRVQFLNTKQEDKQDQSNESNAYGYAKGYDIQKDFDNNSPFGSFDIYDEDIQF